MSLSTNVQNTGQINLIGSDLALFLKVFSGQILSTFEEWNIMEGLITHMTVGPGAKTYQFPAIGIAEAVYHQKGENLLDLSKNYLNNLEMGERTINIDRPLLSSVFVDDWDQMISHFETSSLYARELGKALAVKKDRQLMQLAILAARASATLSATQDGSGRLDKSGLVLGDAAMATSPSVLRAHILEAMQNLVEKDVPMEQLICVLRPAQFYPLMNEGFFINADFNQANGSLANGTFDKAYGFRVVKSNHIPNTLVTAESGQLNSYAGDFTATVGLCFHPATIGAVRRQGVSLETERKIEFQGTLMVAKMVEGYGILRPECAVELTTAT